jgi:plastocyanin
MKLGHILTTAAFFTLASLVGAGLGCGSTEPHGSQSSRDTTDGGSDGSDDGSDGGALVADVGMGPESFIPAELTVKAGTTVHFKNTDAILHTVTWGAGSDDPDVGSKFDVDVKPGEEFDYTFNDVGTWPYFCFPHEMLGMKGVITVVP